MKKWFKTIVFFVTLCAVAAFYDAPVKAATVDIPLEVGANEYVEVYVGDTGRITPITDNLTGITGELVEVTRWQYECYNPEIVALDEQGSYQALDVGSASIYVSGYDALGNQVFYGNCSINVLIDMNQVSIKETSVKGYKTAFSSWEGELTIQSPVLISSYNSEISFSSSNTGMNIYYYLEDNNKISIYTYDTGKTTLTITINGKVYTVKLSIAEVSINKRGLVGIKGKTYTLRVKGTKDAIKWKSTNAKIVKVSKNGKIKLRKNGNAVITATIGDIKVGCAVSVVKKNRKKVINRAIKIGTTWKYSQPKRMLKGFYDCSSLVWKSYTLEKRYFGSTSYAPVAASIAQWCKQKGKVLTKAYNRNHIQKMKFQPGDLAFQTGSNNGRYKGIYHVEMFVGYAVSYYDTSGKPVLNELWAARPEGYYGGGLMVSRPTKK